MENNGDKFCKKCLLKDMPDDTYFNSLYQYIQGIDKELKVNDVIYKERLDICKSCSNLLNGMCRICGCFVELRAAMKKNNCPNINKMW